MPQARGANQRLLFQFESTFRTAPSAAARVLPFSEWGLERSPNRQPDDTIDSSALPAKTQQGDPTVAGPFRSIMCLRTMGNWLKLALGQPTANKAVTKQPTNVTGVLVHWAESDCTSGDGTLAFLSSGSTLSWKANGGTTGATQDVSAGGEFRLQSGGGDKAILVTVTAASLPGGNASDTDIAVSASLKAHTFPINNTLRPSALTELQNSDISKYFRTLGVKANKLNWDVMAEQQNLSGDLIGAYEIDPIPTSAFDGSPTTFTYLRSCTGKGKVWNGFSTALGDASGATVSIDNQMQGIRYGDGLEGFSSIDQGDLLLTGSLRAVFDGSGAYDLARAGTSTRLRLESSAPSGANTFSCVLDMPHVELMEKAPARNSKSGLFADLSWTAHRGTYAPKIVLTNDIASY